MDIECTLREFVDRQAITDLIHAYCERFDRNDPEGVAELFTPDAIIDYNPDTPNIVGAEMAQTIAVGLRDLFAASSHHVSNIMITLEGENEARSLCYIDAWHRYRDGSPDGFLWGRYVNRHQRTAAGWRITSLLLQGAGTIDFHRERMHGIGRG
ncbi:MAG: nuclear transport factor 2 family protein [Chromatocurvus sp.]